MKKYLLLLPLIMACKEIAIPENPQITIEDLYTHELFLTDDAQQGRFAGTKFEKRTADYVEKCFTAFGLEALDGSYIQEFDFISGVKIGENNFIAMDEKGKDRISKESFSTLGFSEKAQVYTDVVFAGYGISAPDIPYDDYENLDVEGKIVVVLRYSPDSKKSDGDFAQYAPLRYKAVTAREKGAAAIIYVTGPNEDSYNDKLRSPATGGGRQSVGIPAIHMKRAVLEEWLASEDHANVQDLQSAIKAHPHAEPAPNSFAIGRKISISIDIEPELSTSRNVIGVLHGAGSLKDEWVVVGGHMDHLGWGGEGSTSMAPDIHDIHNGADDNASGTSAVLELAAYFPKQPLGDNRRSLMFMTFGAEEVGLLGSANYVENPLVPLDQTAAMLNMDMVGRLDNNTLIVSGTGSAEIWEDLLEEVNTDSLSLSLDAEGFGSSDHQSFYLKNIPVLFFFTGAHEDYHRPSDDIDKLNFPGLKKITDLAERTIRKTIYLEERPEFQKGEARAKSSRSGRGYSVTFGVVPDFVYTGDGFKISGVREKAPAGKAGMEAGDIIISINDIEILNIQDYMYALQNCTAGVDATVVIMRGEEEITLIIAPQGKED